MRCAKLRMRLAACCLIFLDWHDHELPGGVGRTCFANAEVVEGRALLANNTSSPMPSSSTSRSGSRGTSVSPMPRSTSATVLTTSSRASAGASTTGSQKVVTSTTKTASSEYRWLSVVDGKYYVNLPSTDNWSMFGPLRTTWTKLRILDPPQVGQRSVIVYLHDWKFSVSNGETSSGYGLKRIEWGIAGDCRGNEESKMRIDLVGTPLQYEATVMKAAGEQAHGGVVCSQSRQRCNASCGGWCGYCGIRRPHDPSGVTAKLVVVDQTMFDAGVAFLYTTITTTRTTITTTSRTHTATSTSTPVPKSQNQASSAKATTSSTGVFGPSGVGGFLGTFTTLVAVVACLLLCWVKRETLMELWGRRYGVFTGDDEGGVSPQTVGTRH